MHPVRTFVLHGPDNAARMMDYVRQNAGPCAKAGTPLVAKFQPKEDARTLEQNAKIHAMCADVAKQVKWAGKMRSTVDWKRLLVDAFDREKQTMGEIVPSLDGTGVVVLNRLTRDFGIREGAEFIEYLYCWGADQGIQWKEAKTEEVI